MELYGWQRQCLEAWEQNGCRGTVSAVTGAGKTALALAAVGRLRQRFPNLCVRVVAPTVPLAAQWKAALLRRAPSETWRPGFFGGGERDAPDRQVMIYVVNSARDALAGHIRRDLALNRHVLLICDEYHHYQSPQNRRIFDFFTPETAENAHYACLGLSATPPENREAPAPDLALGNEVYRYGLGEAVREGVVSPFRLCEVSASFLPDELRAYAELSRSISVLLRRLLEEHPRLRDLERRDFMSAVHALAAESGMDPEETAAAFILKTYERKKLSASALARVRCGLALLERLSPSDRVLVFCERISQAAEMERAIRQRWGNVCGIYHSRLTRQARERNLREFREHRTGILVCCRCLDEGLDVPDAGVGIVLSSTAVERQRVQRLGRLIRVSPDKLSALLYYIYIEESTDDRAYLPGLNAWRSFGLRYDSFGNCFSSDLYEYAAGDLLRRAAEREPSADRLWELRRCLMEGMTRGDFLLPAEAAERRLAAAGTRHAQNYWRAMKKLGEEYFQDRE
ncbi:MAG: DEAD/DEAH box helicase [Oscillospiraceae bacterium]|nr:DEAD/DEAH box helicase [Oscillospiraceae bacterium]